MLGRKGVLERILEPPSASCELPSAPCDNVPNAATTTTGAPPLRRLPIRIRRGERDGLAVHVVVSTAAGGAPP